MIFRWISIGTRVALATSVPLILLAYVEHTVIEQRVQVTLHDSHRVMTEIVAKQLVTRIRLDLELEDETRIRNAVAELARELGDLERVKIELQSGETYLDWQRAVHRKDGPAPAELVVRGQSEPLGRLWLWLDDARLREIALGVQRHVHLFLFAGVLLTIGICLVVGAWLRRCFSELSQAMGRIEAGDWGVRVPEGSGEIGRVGEAFNNMIATMRAAEKENRLLGEAVEQASEMILITDEGGSIRYVNPSFERVTGWPAAEVIGKSPRFLLSGEHDESFYQAMWAALQKDDGWSGVLSNRKKDGSLLAQDTTLSAVRDSSGKVIHYVSVGRDVSERRLLEAQLRQAQKLESIGQLAAGIAHEINTPTQYVGDNTRFLRDAFEDLTGVVEKTRELLEVLRGGADGSKLLEELAAAVERADLSYLAEEIPRAIGESLEGVERVSGIVGAMKEFSHPGGRSMSQVDLNHAIQSTITVSRNEWKYVSELVTDLDPALPPVPCLPGEIHQVILNIIVNAAHAIGGQGPTGGSGAKGTITVSSRLEGDWAEIRIADTGSGIPEEIRARIFDPFFTTKEVGKGTGQGLAIAHATVVKKHGGELSFETEMGKGTVFIVRLPLSPSEAPAEEVGA